MKNMVKGLLLAVVTIGSFAVAEPIWENRPNVVRAAETLAQEVEALDTALHNVTAPDHIIQKVHHFEETVTEFAEDVRTMPYQEAVQEMSHIRQDVDTLRQELSAHPQLLQNPAINNEWRHVRSAYRNLDHQMFQLGGGLRDAQLKKEMAEIEEAHQ